MTNEKLNQLENEQLDAVVGGYSNFECEPEHTILSNFKCEPEHTILSNFGNGITSIDPARRGNGYY